MKAGTIWVAPNEGATSGELFEALHNVERQTSQVIVLFNRLIRRPNNLRTNLSLTGEPLTDYDIRRIEAATN